MTVRDKFKFGKVVYCPNCGKAHDYVESYSFSDELMLVYNVGDEVPSHKNKNVVVKEDMVCCGGNFYVYVVIEHGIYVGAFVWDEMLFQLSYDEEEYDTSDSGYTFALPGCKFDAGVTFREVDESFVGIPEDVKDKLNEVIENAFADTIITTALEDELKKHFNAVNIRKDNNNLYIDVQPVKSAEFIKTQVVIDTGLSLANRIVLPIVRPMGKLHKLMTITDDVKITADAIILEDNPTKETLERAEKEHKMIIVRVDGDAHAVLEKQEQLMRELGESKRVAVYTTPYVEEKETEEVVNEFLSLGGFTTNYSWTLHNNSIVPKSVWIRYDEWTSPKDDGNGSIKDGYKLVKIDYDTGSLSLQVFNDKETPTPNKPIYVSYSYTETKIRKMTDEEAKEFFVSRLNNEGWVAPAGKKFNLSNITVVDCDAIRKGDEMKSEGHDKIDFEEDDNE